MKVSEIMTAGPLVIQADAKVSEAAKVMREGHVGGLPVLDGTRLVGIVTDSDLLSLLKTGDLSDDLWLPSPLEIIEVPIREFINWERTKGALSDISAMKVREVMSVPAITIDQEAEISEAAAVMLREKIVRLPVLKGRDLIGIVTRSDIVQGIGSAAEGGIE